MVFDTSDIDMDDNNYKLAYGKSLIPMYLSENDCKYAIDYFENTFGADDGNVGYQEKGCQYLDLSTSVNHSSNYDVVCGEYEQNDNSCDQTQRIISRIVDYFYDNYKNVLNDCSPSDVTMIKYISNGTGYSGLHSENYYIDGKAKENFINGDVGGSRRHIDWVAIVFLNDDFIGGDLQFIGSNAINNVKAQIGNGVLFGGGLEYSHRVSPVTNGHRYVVKIVFSK